MALGKEGRREIRRLRAPNQTNSSTEKIPAKQSNLVLDAPGGNCHISLPMFMSPSVFLFILLIQNPRLIPDSYTYNLGFFLPMTLLKTSLVVLSTIFSNTLPIMNWPEGTLLLYKSYVLIVKELLLSQKCVFITKVAFKFIHLF